MLEKLSTHSSENEENLSGRDKAMKAQEKKKLEAMIERHKGLMGPTMEAQSMWTPRVWLSFPNRGGCCAALSLNHEFRGRPSLDRTAPAVCRSGFCHDHS